MVKQLFVLVLLVAATVSASAPAQASTLTVSNLVCENWGASFSCEASVSGGTGTYTSFVWGVATSSGTSYYNASGPYFDYRCYIGRWYSVQLSVTDSAGAFSARSTDIYCTKYPQ